MIDDALPSKVSRHKKRIFQTTFYYDDVDDETTSTTMKRPMLPIHCNSPCNKNLQIL